MKSVRAQVFDLREQGKSKDEILSYFGEKNISNAQTIKTYISYWDCNVSGNAENTTKEDKCKLVFLDLENGLDDVSICDKYEICSKTLDSFYKGAYRKQFDLIGKRNIVFSQLNYAHHYYNEEKENILPENTTMVKKDSNSIENQLPFKIGMNKYDIRFYILNDLVWFDFMDILDALKSANVVYDKSKISISEKYLSEITISGKQRTLIDRNILLDFANQIGDHTFIRTVIDMIVTNKNVFYRVQEIIDAINSIADIVKELNETGNSQIKVFETMCLDILHYIEKNELSDAELLEQVKKLQNARTKRRVYKNSYILGHRIKSSIACNNSHSEALRMVAAKIQPILNDLYNKVYNNRCELTEEEQEELLK